VDNDVAVIQQYPAGDGSAFAVERHHPVFLEGLRYLVRDGVQLASGFAVYDDEKIGETADTACIQKGDVGCQLVAGNLDDAAGFIDGFQCNFSLAL